MMIYKRLHSSGAPAFPRVAALLERLARKLLPSPRFQEELSRFG